MDQSRFYRNWIDSDLFSFTVQDQQTDIFISAEKNLKTEAEKLIHQYRTDIINYIKTKPEFEICLDPMPPDEGASEIVKSMLRASGLVGVGPMAAVAGAISEFAGRGLLRFTSQIILENGGDIFMKTKKPRRIGIYAGRSTLTGKVGIKIKPELTPFGICTSSGTVGHSLSFGKADAVCVLAHDTALADVCATAACNKVKSEADIEGALNFIKSIDGTIGAVVIYKNRIGSIGDIELIKGAIL